jgi:hypothetical protein
MVLTTTIRDGSIGATPDEGERSKAKGKTKEKERLLRFARNDRSGRALSFTINRAAWVVQRS